MGALLRCQGRGIGEDLLSGFGDGQFRPPVFGGMGFVCAHGPGWSPLSVSAPPVRGRLVWSNVVTYPNRGGEGDNGLNSGAPRAGAKREAPVRSRGDHHTTPT